jgi:hypothetical protein
VSQHEFQDFPRALSLFNLAHHLTLPGSGARSYFFFFAMRCRIGIGFCRLW